MNKKEHKNSPHSTVDYLCCVLYFRRALETSEDVSSTKACIEYITHEKENQYVFEKNFQ